MIARSRTFWRAFLLSNFSLLLSACFDFDALSAGAEPMAPDLSFVCDKEKNALREICDNGADDNDDCLTDCADPQCADSLLCLPNLGQFIGHGALYSDISSCPGGTTSAFVMQQLQLNPDCSPGCGCQSASMNCLSTLHWFANQSDCTAKANELDRIGVQSYTSGSVCRNIPGSTINHYFRLDPVSKICPVDTTKHGTLQHAWGKTQKLCMQQLPCATLECILKQSTCIFYNGEVESCPSTFEVRDVWHQGVTDSRVCTCSCYGASSGCAIMGSEAQFTESATCTTGVRTNNLTAAQVDTCVQAGISGNAVAAQAMNFSARPICQSSGSTSSDLKVQLAAGNVAYIAPITSCCKKSGP